MDLEVDHYDTLGVTPDAATSDLLAAYRRRLRMNHPDASHGVDAAAKTMQIIEAFAVLGDPARRGEYDRARSARAVRSVPVVKVRAAETSEPAFSRAVGRRLLESPRLARAAGKALVTLYLVLLCLATGCGLMVLQSFEQVSAGAAELGHNDP